MAVPKRKLPSPARACVAPTITWLFPMSFTASAVNPIFLIVSALSAVPTRGVRLSAATMPSNETQSAPRIAVDAMGGDFGPCVVVPAAVEAAREGIDIALVGDEAAITPSFPVLMSRGWTFELSTPHRLLKWMTSLRMRSGARRIRPFRWPADSSRKGRPMAWSLQATPVRVWPAACSFLGVSRAFCVLRLRA